MGRNRGRRGGHIPRDPGHVPAAGGIRACFPGLERRDLRHRPRPGQDPAALRVDLARRQIAGSRDEVFGPRSQRRGHARFDRQTDVRSLHHGPSVPEASAVAGGLPEEFPVTGARSRRFRREEGFVLFLAIFVLLVITAAGLATMFATSMDLTLSSNETKVSKVFYAADSGIEYCAAKLR